MHQPPVFRGQQHPDHVCLLQKSLYGLKQAPRSGFRDLQVMLLVLDFHIVVVTLLYLSIGGGLILLIYYYMLMILY